MEHKLSLSRPVEILFDGQPITIPEGTSIVPAHLSDRVRIIDPEAVEACEIHAPSLPEVVAPKRKAEPQLKGAAKASTKPPTPPPATPEPPVVPVVPPVTEPATEPAKLPDTEGQQ